MTTLSGEIIKRDLQRLISQRPMCVLEKREINLILSGKVQQVIDEDIEDDRIISQIS
jgi:hypothetical protein